MKTILLLLISGVFQLSWPIGLLKEQQLLSQSDTLFWQPGLKLRWDDFLASAPEGNPFAAFTYTIVSLDYSAKVQEGMVRPDFRIRCAFNRSKSWVNREKPGAMSPKILAHEQLHFDIAELTARRLREALQGKTFPRASYSATIDAIYKEITSSGEELQKRYDRETEHGLRVPIQLSWEREIAEELQKLHKWALTEGSAD